ncbi:hypothetical protein B0H11DRAFT_2237849 [Mycena galericulata]|nr:hypothetical protein B0H11DRAFT_2237849 [Mycena galericulata]
MSQLPPRLHCVDCLSNGPGGCAGFTARDIDPTTGYPFPRATPTGPFELCAVPCQHPWTSHHPVPARPTDPNYTFRRGPCHLSGCAGFFSTLFRWDMQTLCVCGYALNAHAVIGNEPAGTHSAFLPPPQSQPALDLGFSTPPVDAFLGVLPLRPSSGPPHPPPPGSTNARRTASAARTLPQHQGAVANASATHRGPRRPYPPPYLGLSAGASTSGSSSSSVSVPAAGNPFAAPRVAVLIPGQYEPDAHATLPFKIRTEVLLDYINALEPHGLFFHPTFPATGNASPMEFTNQLRAHLALNGLHLPVPQPSTVLGPEPVLFHRQPFAVLHPTRYRHITTFSLHPSMSVNTFSYAEMKKLGKKMPNPDPDPAHNQEPLVIIGEFSFQDGAMLLAHCIVQLRVTVISAAQLRTPNSPRKISLKLGATFHTRALAPDLLMGWITQATLTQMRNVIATAPKATTSSGVSVPPPRVERPSTPMNMVSLIRQRSPTSQTDDSAARRVRPRAGILPIESLAIDPFSSDVEDTHPPPPPPRRPPVIPLQPGVDIALVSDVMRWQAQLARKLRSATAENLYISGETLDDAAQCFLLLLEHLERRKAEPDCSFQPPHNIARCNVDDICIESLFQDYATVRIGTGARGSTGPGPYRAMFRVAAQIMCTQFRFWKPLATSAFIVPNFSLVAEPLAARSLPYAAHGMFLALHCFTLCQPAAPVSIWLLLALVLGKKAMLVPKNILLYIDPQAYDILAPCEIPNERSEEEHEAWTIMAFSDVLLGHLGPWNHSDFLSIQRGFNVVMKDVCFAQTIQTRNPLAFFLCMYDRRVKSVEDVSAHLSVTMVNRHSDGTTPLFAKLFSIYLRRYMQGTGHPPELRGREALTDEDFESAAQDPLLRTRLVLACAGDFEMLPMELHWSITFQLQGRVISPSPIAGPLHFHSCSTEVDVKLDRGLQELLLAGLGDDDQTSNAFDVWVHSQFLNRQYNTV